MIPSSHCEAKKHAYRQTQDGIVVSFVLHPNEVPDDLALAALGTRYMLALSRIGDDEEPQEPEQKPKRPVERWESMSPVKQAAILCNDDQFQDWSAPGQPSFDGARNYILHECGITSRKHLTAEGPRHAWAAMVAKFRADTGRTAEQRG